MSNNIVPGACGRTVFSGRGYELPRSGPPIPCKLTALSRVASGRVKKSADHPHELEFKSYLRQGFADYLERTYEHARLGECLGWITNPTTKKAQLYIKDHFTGVIRPKIMRDDMWNSMTEARLEEHRRRWEEQQDYEPDTEDDDDAASDYSDDLDDDVDDGDDEEEDYSDSGDDDDQEDAYDDDDDDTVDGDSGYSSGHKESDPNEDTTTQEPGGSPVTQPVEDDGGDDPFEQLIQEIQQELLEKWERAYAERQQQAAEAAKQRR